MSSRFDWTVLLSAFLAGGCIATIAILASPLADRSERFQLLTVGSGITAHMNKRTGEVVFLGPTGAVVGSYPVAAFDPDAFLRQAKTAAKESLSKP